MLATYTSPNLNQTHHHLPHHYAPNIERFPFKNDFYFTYNLGPELRMPVRLFVNQLICIELKPKKHRCDRSSNSDQVSNMSGVNTKSLSTERPQSSCSDKIPDMSQVNKNRENTELLTDTEICALTDKQSIQQVIDHFRPAIRTVLRIGTRAGWLTY